MGASENPVDPETSFDYRPRVADAELSARLAATGAVLIEGPRGCGKTETARQAAASEVRLDIGNVGFALALESSPQPLPSPYRCPPSRGRRQTLALRRSRPQCG